MRRPGFTTDPTVDELEKELIVPAIVGSSIPGRGFKRTGAPRRRSVMSEKQVQAYLAARETVRRVKRASEFFPRVSHSAAGIRFDAGHPDDRIAST